MPASAGISAIGLGFPAARQGWGRGLVFMTTALILAIVVVLVLAFAVQRLLNNEATITAIAAAA